MIRRFALLGALIALCAGCGSTATVIAPGPREHLKPVPRLPVALRGSLAASHASLPVIQLVSLRRHGGPPHKTGVPTEGLTPHTAAAPTVGETFTVTSNGSWTINGVPTLCGANGMTCTYAWTHGSAGVYSTASGSPTNSNTYTIVSGDLGDTIELTVTATNLEGSAAQTSVPSGVVGGAAGVPASPSGQTVTGTASVGNVITATNGSWTNTPTSYTYQWQRCYGGNASDCVNMSGATCTDTGGTLNNGCAYTLLNGDALDTYQAIVTAINATGSSAPTTSSPTSVVNGLTALSQPSGTTTEVLNDSFAGTTLNSSNWIPEMSDPGTIWCGNYNVPCNGINSQVGNGTGSDNAEYGDSSQVNVNNGLTLFSKLSSAISGYTWEAGYVSSYNKIDFPHGTATGTVYVQVLAKMPDVTQGEWPSIWMMNGTCSSSCDSIGGEIDIDEGGFLNTGCTTTAVVNDCMASNPNITGQNQSHVNTGTNLSTSYNVYGMKWVSGTSETFYLNGTQTAQYTTSIPTSASPGVFDLIMTSTMFTDDPSVNWHTLSSCTFTTSPAASCGSTPTPASPLIPPMQIAQVQVWQ